MTVDAVREVSDREWRSILRRARREQRLDAILSPTLDALVGCGHWGEPIRAIIPAAMGEAARAAIEFFDGSPSSLVRLPDGRLLVEAIGQRARWRAAGVPDVGIVELWRRELVDDEGYLCRPAPASPAVSELEPPLTVSEVARVMRVTEPTVREWLRKGTLRGVKLSKAPRGDWRIPRSEIERLTR